MRLVSLLAELLAIGVAWFVAGKSLGEPSRGRLQNVLKAWLTVRIFWLLLGHEVEDSDGTRVAIGALILRTLKSIDAEHVRAVLRRRRGHQVRGNPRLDVALDPDAARPGHRAAVPPRVRRVPDRPLPRHVPAGHRSASTATRSTTPRASAGAPSKSTAAKFLEKVIGPIGIFVCFLVALPFGMNLLYDHTEIFPTRAAADTAAFASAAVCLAIVSALLAVLWFPGIVQVVIERLPLPGKARLTSIVARVSGAAGAYRNHKLLLLQALALSFVVHFTTAAMYYFTALAIGAIGAEFWPIVLGSTIQILATVLSPITIAGEGIRELAQLLVLQHMIGAAAAVASAALGFWAAEALTLFGGVYWWVRGPSYTPAYCLVNGVQVDYAAAETASVAAPPTPFEKRARMGAARGLGAGLFAGIVLALGEAAAIAQQGFGTEAQVLWYGPFVYAAFFGALCALGGVALAAFPMDESESRGWTASLALLATLVPVGLAITVFRLRRDVYLEQMPPPHVLAAVIGGFGALAVFLFFVGPRLFRGRVGQLFSPPIAIALLILAVGGGWLAAGELARPVAQQAAPPARDGLASRPNVILVMVDTLRADHLSCYGGEFTPTPNLCRIAARWWHDLQRLLARVVDEAVHRDAAHVARIEQSSGDGEDRGVAFRDRHARRGVPAHRLRNRCVRLEHEPDRGLRLRAGLRRVPLPRP